MITIKFLQQQVGGVHVVAVTQVPGVFVGVCGQSVKDIKTGNRCFHDTLVQRKCLTPDDITDPAVRIDAADLLGMCRVHLHLPAKEESLEEGEGTRREGAKFELQNNPKLQITNI